MEARGSRRLLEEPASDDANPSSFPTDGDAAIAIAGPGGHKKELDKRSLDYIVRTGVAGGLAGCAVRPTTAIDQREHMLIQYLV